MFKNIYFCKQDLFFIKKYKNSIKMLFKKHPSILREVQVQNWIEYGLQNLQLNVTIKNDQLRNILKDEHAKEGFQ